MSFTYMYSCLLLWYRYAQMHHKHADHEHVRTPCVLADPTCGMMLTGWFCQSPGKSCKAGPWQRCAILQAVKLLTCH